MKIHVALILMLVSTPLLIFHSGCAENLQAKRAAWAKVYTPEVIENIKRKEFLARSADLRGGMPFDIVRNFLGEPVSSETTFFGPCFVFTSNGKRISYGSKQQDWIVAVFSSNELTRWEPRGDCYSYSHLGGGTPTIRIEN